jgi:hypothetical protein
MHIRPPCRGFFTALLTYALCNGAIIAATLDIPFYFSRRAIGIEVTVHGVPLYVLLDTGVGFGLRRLQGGCGLSLAQRLRDE